MNIRIERVRLNPNDAHWFFKPKIDYKNDTTVRTAFNKRDVILSDWEETKILAQKYSLSGEHPRGMEIIVKYLAKEKNPDALYFFSLFGMSALNIIEKMEKNFDKKNHYLMYKIIEGALESSLKMNPANYHTYVLKYRVYENMDEEKKAKEVLSQMESVFLLEPFSRLNKAEQKAKEGKIDEALQYIADIEKFYKVTFHEIFCFLKDVIISTNTYSFYDPKEVVTSLEEEIKSNKKNFLIEGIELPPITGEDYIDLAIQYLRMGDYKNSQMYAKKALEFKEEYYYEADLINVLTTMAYCSALSKCTTSDYLENFNILNKIKTYLMVNKKMDYGVVVADTINSLNALIFGQEKDRELIDLFLSSAADSLKIALKIYPFFVNFQEVIQTTTAGLAIKYELIK